MLQKIRNFFETPAGRVVGVALVAIAAVYLYLSIRSTVTSEAAAITRERIFICTETGKPFDVTIEPGDEVPLKSPHSGKNTGVPAELCYWTKEGTPTDTPTPVLLNEYLGKREPTFCPSCDRLVVARNPAPVGDAPPTREQFQARRGSAAQR